MKNISIRNKYISTIFVGLLCSMFFIQSAKANDFYLGKSDTVSLVSSIIRKPLVDRGISNHSFIAKNSFIGGVTFNYLNFDSKDSKFLFSMLDNVSYSASMLGFSPYFGYSIAENKIIGIRASYSTVNASLDNFDVKFGDLGVSLGDLSYKQKNYGLGFFYRSYVGLDEGHRFGLFSEWSLSYRRGESNFIRGRDKSLKDYYTIMDNYDLGMSPGVAVFIAQNVCMELSFNVMGFNYKKEKQKLNGLDNGSFESSGIDFRINPFNINIGLTISI